MEHLFSFLNLVLSIYKSQLWTPGFAMLPILVGMWGLSVMIRLNFRANAATAVFSVCFFLIVGIPLFYVGVTGLAVAMNVGIDSIYHQFFAHAVWASVALVLLGAGLGHVWFVSFLLAWEPKGDALAE